MRTIHATLTLCAGLLLSTQVPAADCADGSGPQEAVKNYISAMQNHTFSKAYDFVTAKMTDGKSREDWAAQQKLFYEGGEVNVLGMDIRKAQAPADDAACAKQAFVPNILKSRDKFNNQGTTEFEVYTLVKEGDAWKIDAQETLFDADGVKKWFPGEEVPDFEDQY